MSAKPENLTKHELIGLMAEVVESSDPTRVGLKGRIVDETRNTFTIESKGKEKIVAKAECTFRFSLDHEVVEVDGKVLVARPEDRIKKV
jgi:ribonuclease P protein subunit POP4